MPALVALVLMTGRAFAANPYAVGDTITNPESGATETVTDLLGDDMVLTDQDHAIRVLNTAVGDMFDDPDSPGTTLEVTAVHTNATTGLEDSITVTDNASPPNIRDIVLVKPVDQSAPPADPGNPGGSVPLPIPTGNTNVVSDARVGSQGAAGHDGFGVRVCIIVCFTIGRNAAPGEPGGPGPAINDTITGADIESVSPSLPGVTASSRGGNGGHGGDAYVSLGVDAAQGGAAGAGGNVTVTSGVDITTGGTNSYGLFAQSRAGNAGSGGNGYVLSAAGGGGPPAQAGDVLLTNTGKITTQGDGAVGLYAQSLGGGGGSGGDSYGIVGVAGSASQGGNGGNATAVNNGVITTAGAAAHGILAESIGGDGGDAGAAGGIVGLGGSGDSGGTAGTASATNNGHVTTLGEGSIGIFSQAVGGGGGNGGGAGGLVSIGGSGAGGGDGGATSAANTGTVQTLGASADALLAQSVGGGGGTGGSSGGAFFTLGGSGGGGGAGNTVTVTNRGSLTTAGDDSIGLLAQSIGGGGGRAGGGGRGGGGGDGGGNGGGAGSLSAFGGVSIGGSGGNGGNGSTVTVTSSDYADIHTQGDRATGLLAQSLGGGGGAGGFAAQVTAGYLAGVSVAVGGSGGGGGAGGTVNVNGNSTITTEGQDADGLSAQSLGGGGGKGGFAVSFAGAAGGAAGISLAVGVGGKGGGGGNGGDVHVNAGGDITTQGDMSEGLFAQSLGGGGGKGGFSVTIGAAASGGVAGSVAVGVGGSGGGGGDAGTVDVTYGGDVSTQGDDARAVDIQAAGGGGGNGAFNVSGTVQGAGGGGAGVTVGVGGSGGGGGDGGVVVANITGDLTAQGRNSNALFVQSSGGGGGSGAFNVSGSITATSGAGGAVAVGVGGSGGDGGDGKSVTSNLIGDATTHGAAADAVFVQSIGGAGGNGAFNVSGAVSLTTGGSAGVAVGVGGSGGGGGDGGAVSSKVTGDINTYAETAGGFIAQSVGGSGGNGAFNVSGAISVTAEGSGAASVGFGGSGGDGGDGSTVDATMQGDVTTRGATSNGVFAQSLGGSGGNGAFNVSGGISASSGGGGALSIGVGGSGGGGGDGKAVNLTVAGDVTTSGMQSAGITAQSLGGGGGNGAFNVTGGVAASGAGAGTIGVGFGGAGGDGGDADEVIAHVTGITSTQGADSNAVLVQSNGGGGGNGAFNVTGDLTVAQAGGGGIGLGVGGFGGGGGDGGIVDATVTGDATTQGDRSNGVLLQSKGGGGGNGAINVTGGLSLTGLSTSGTGATIGIGVGGFGGDGGNGSTVTGHVTGTVTTHGDDALGVLAQSVGGGGGNGALNVTGAVQLSTNSSAGAAIGVGGFGGGGGNAGTVTLVRSGATTTDGANSDGVVAQSLGGAGGNGGINISGALSLAISNPTPATNLAGTFGLGGFGGDGGDAQNVNATVTGDVQATGYGGDILVLDDGIGRIVRADGSNGVLAQSVGGDGGNGRLNVSAGIAFAAPSSGNSSGALNIGVGGWAGGGGDAGTVDLQVDAGIVKSFGDDRVGVGAQSLGGAGGNGGINVTGGIVLDGQANFGVGGFGGDGGVAQRVTATANTDINASGGGAIGFLAQSVGGGGGKGRINVTGGIQGATDSSTPSMSFGLGGFGGAGNASGNVTATQNGSITVDGADSIGVLAQSVGGGGGIGGLDVSGNLGLGKGYTGGIGIGGKGGIGANAGTVTLHSDGQIVVDGTEPQDPNAPAPTPEQREQIDFRQRANGILAQSLGGGGGNGGINVTGVVAPIGSPLGVGVGGFGGAGGDANVVSVNRGLNAPALLQTIGNNANGLTAQSIGGGGGNAGADILLEGAGATSDTEAQQVELVVGGAGGAAGEGQTVTVEQVGDIATDGDHSDAILAQSIGGGGGNAALSLGAGLNVKTTGINVAVGGGPGDGGSGEKVTVHHTGTISTQGFDSSAIFAQSIGGGGGNAAFTLATSLRSQGSFDLGLGRKGGTGGMGRDVEVTSSGDLSTHGDRAIGILAQSVGNGGGKSGAFSIGGKGPSGAEGSGQSTKGTLAVGLEGGQGGSAGAVHVTTDGSISTDGSDAYAIHAQSIGGGGGIGGGATNLVFLDTNTVGVGVGGQGGTGGVSDTVNIDNSAALTTQGDGAHAIYAQSLGGAGGVGGYAGVMKLVAGASAADGSFTGTVSVGGKGGTGANGDTVDVTNRGSIVTHGEKAFGVDAESVGGGGGDGGMVINGAITSGTQPTSLSLGVGGSGNTGGTSARVTVINEGTVHTTGEGSVGIKARSVGGGGGNGGLVANLNLTTSGTESSGLNAGVNIGGSGGEGNAGGAVEVTNRHGETGGGGLIMTEEDSADGIYAESVGGGGGDGSSVVSAMLARGGEETIAVGVNVGGDGGTGGTGGTVTVTNETQIETQGSGSSGIVARSVGGGGGSGGMVLATNAIFSSAARGNTPLVVAGGSGGAGNTGGAVVVNNSGSIVTHGDRSDGIVAKSIGGGGGDAGLGLGLTSGVATTAVAGVGSVLFGGRGGEGGEGGTVTVNHSGDITVLGNNSHAVAAESINGGGGGIALDFNGITSLPGGVALPGSPQGTETQPVFVFHGGGSGVQTSNAGRVTLNYTGTFNAAGNDGSGNSAQAIGGGGGNFDANLGIVDSTTAPEDRIELQGTLGGTDGMNNDGGEIASTHVGDVVTAGLNTPGLLMQSIGGGGGRVNFSVSTETGALGASTFGIGGENGTDERGGDVTHSQSGSISTGGATSHGALLQSIGGGGGLLSYRLGSSAAPPVATAGRIKLDVPRFHVAAASGAADASVHLGLGSAGGSGLDGGTIQLDLSGDVATGGDNAVGLVLQSVGAGGGAANVIGADALDVVLGGSAGAGGNGGAIDVTHTGNVSTAGARSHGVIVQSIGGGGSAVFTDVAAPTVTVSSDNAGNGGNITFTQIGDILTSGTETRGLLAQSLGGGGGFVDGAFAGTAGGAGAGGTISLTVDGDVVTLGERSTALTAQSSGGLGAGDIRASLTAGHHLVGGVDGVAVAFEGGANNVFGNHGAIMTMSGPTGVAFTGGDGNDAFVNDGIVVGNIALGSGRNRFANNADATLYAGATLDLGAADNLLVNDGVLAPGGMQRALVTNLSGSFHQSAGGLSAFELDFSSGTLDSLIATGTAQLDGSVDVSLLDTQAVKPGRYTKVLYSAAGGLTDTGLALSTQPSVVIHYNLLHPDANTVSLGYDVDFAADGLEGNRVAVGRYINRMQAAGSSAALSDTISALVQTPSLASYSDELTQIGAELYAEEQVLALGSLQRFSRSLQNCGGTGFGPVWNTDSGCVWARIESHPASRDVVDGFPGIDEAGRQYSFGVEQAGSDGWSFGAGVAFEKNTTSGFGGAWDGDVSVVQLGLHARREFGRSSAGAVLALGSSDQRLQRRIDVPGPATATGTRSVPFVSGVLNLRHGFGLYGLTVTPGIDLGFSVLSGGRLSESGAGALDTILAHKDETHAWTEPMIAFGFERALASRRLLRAYARLGVLQYLGGATTEVQAGLEGAPSGVEPMRIRSGLDATHFLASGGLELIVSDRFTLALDYTEQRSDSRESRSASARFALGLD